MSLHTFEERYEYLDLVGRVGDATFGSKRYLNQILYTSKEWLKIRRDAIVRDNGYDLGFYGREIKSVIIVHHMNPITIEDVLHHDPKVFDPEFLICASDMTHRAIHYGNSNLLEKDFIERSKNDTCPWRH